jgi:hypothetical protein
MVEGGSVKNMNRDKVLNYSDPPDNWKEQLVNACIQAGFNFFSTLAGVTATGVIRDPMYALVASGISAGLGFFASLMVQRGLMKPEEVKVEKESGKAEGT